MYVHVIINIKLNVRIIVICIYEYMRFYVYQQLMLFLFMNLSKNIRKFFYLFVIFYYMRSIMIHAIPFYNAYTGTKIKYD